MKVKKWLDKYFTSTSAGLSLFMGILSFLITMNIVEWKLALLGSLMVVVVFLLLLPVILWRSDKKYHDVMMLMSGKSLYSANVNLNTNRTQRNGYLFLLSDSIAFYGRDKKPHLEFIINYCEKVQIQLIDAVHLTISIPEEEREYRIVSSACKELAAQLRAQGWNCL